MKDTPFSEQDYYREVLEVCGYEAKDIDEKLHDIEEEGTFEAWPYYDRIYCDPWVQDITEAEHKVLSRYLYCR